MQLSSRNCCVGHVQRRGRAPNPTHRNDAAPRLTSNDALCFYAPTREDGGRAGKPQHGRALLRCLRSVCRRFRSKRRRFGPFRRCIPPNRCWFGPSCGQGGAALGRFCVAFRQRGVALLDQVAVKEASVWTFSAVHVAGMRRLKSSGARRRGPRPHRGACPCS